MAFSMSIGLITMRLLLLQNCVLVASVRHWFVSRLDVKNVFLNSELREEVYIQPPPGYSTPYNMLSRLHRLYGFKKASRAWFERFASMVDVTGFQRVLKIRRCLPSFLLLVGLFFMLMT